MTKSQWQDVCNRISDIWPGAKRIPDGTVNAWYEQGGSWMEYDAATKTVERLGDNEHRRPTFALFRETYSTIAGPRPRVGEQMESSEAKAADRRRWNEIGQKWIRIILCLHDAGVCAMLRALDDAETDPIEARDALLLEIAERDVKPREMKPIRKGGLDAIGDILPVAI